VVVDIGLPIDPSGTLAARTPSNCADSTAMPIGSAVDVGSGGARSGDGVPSSPRGGGGAVVIGAADESIVDTGASIDTQGSTAVRAGSGCADPSDMSIGSAPDGGGARSD